MESAPSLVLVPPTPSDDLQSFSRSTSRTAVPESKYYLPPRDSSDTAIVSIYSMYGDDTGRSSWSSAQSKRDTAHSDQHKSRHSKPTDSEIAYYSNEPLPKPPRSRAIDLQKAALIKSGSSDSYCTPQQRPASSYYASASSSLDSIDHRRSASDDVRSDHTASRSIPSISQSSPSRRARPLSRSNSHHKSDSLDRDLPPLPPLPPSISSTPPRQRSPTTRQRSLTPTRQRTPTPTRQRTPTPTRPRLIVPDASPSSSSVMPLKHPPPVAGSPSKTSLVPSEGEDLDGFHVRNTYALLEMSGVKGDGFVDGVERTRARIGDSRASQLDAENAIGDGSEKSQELEFEQIKALSSVDR